MENLESNVGCASVTLVCALAGVGIAVASPIILTYYIYRGARRRFDEEYKVIDNARRASIKAKEVVEETIQVNNFFNTGFDARESEAFEKYRESLRQVVSFYSKKGDEQKANIFRRALNEVYISRDID